MVGQKERSLDWVWDLGMAFGRKWPLSWILRNEELSRRRKAERKEMGNSGGEIFTCKGDSAARICPCLTHWDLGVEIWHYISCSSLTISKFFLHHTRIEKGIFECQSLMALYSKEDKGSYSSAIWKLPSHVFVNVVLGSCHLLSPTPAFTILLNKSHRYTQPFRMH